MNTYKTYAVGINGQVKRSYDLGDTWTDVPVTTGVGTADTLLDVEVTPDGNTVVAVGLVNEQTGYLGVYYSLDDGETWNASGGDYATAYERSFTWYEISIVVNNNIFISGYEGWVAKSTDGGLTFNLCTRITGLYASYADRQGMKVTTLNCHSLHFISANIGVVGLQNNVVLTTDGGTTWVKCCGGNGIEENQTGVGFSGTWMGGVHCYQPIPGNPGLIITALSTNYIFQSTDNGVTFQESWTFSKPEGTTWGGYHLTWTDELTLWGFGYNHQIVKSIDGGATWTSVRLYIPNNDTYVAGHFYTNTEGFYGRTPYSLTTGFIDETSDGATSGTVSESFDPSPTAIWTWLGEATCYGLIPCDPNLETITIADDLFQYVGGSIELCVPEVPVVTYPQEGKAFTIVDCCGELPDQKIRTRDLFWYHYETMYLPNFHNRCWRAGKEEQPDPTYVGINTLGAISFGTFADSCQTCLEVNPCPSPQPPPGCTCYTVEVAQNCDGAIYMGRDWEITAYQDCNECLGGCYLLTSECGEGDLTAVVTGEGLSQGDIVKVAGSSHCWLVSETLDCEHAQPIGTFTVYATCEECNPDPVMPPYPLNVRLVKPGYNTPGCDPDYTEKTNCKFANAVYNQMTIARYGIKMCCSIDVQKWDIKKQLLDFKAIYDPEACGTVEDETECSSCD